MLFLDTLAERGVINRYQAQEIQERAEEKYDGDLDKALAESKIDEIAILDAKAVFYNIEKRIVNKADISFDLLKYIPEDSANYYKFVPIGVSEGVLEVGIIDPANSEARNALQFISSQNNIPFKLFVITPGDFAAIAENYKGMNQEFSAAVDGLQEELLDVDKTMVKSGDMSGRVPDFDDDSTPDTSTPNSANKIVEDAPVTKMVAVVLRHAVEGRASDVHIENTGDKVKVRFRVDGTLHTSLFLPQNVHSPMVARVKILAKLKLDEKRKPQDGRFYAKIEGRKVDFRVSTLPTFHGEKVVIRILDPDNGVKTIDQTGMRPEHIAMVREAIKRPYGLILITGPTGSGKTSTLYSMLKELDREGSNVVSLEDPIEYNIEGMNQSQVRPEIGYTFANGLRSILRQDPDVIMVGEIRDKETAQLAIQAALTGHLVFATLHTNNSIGVIPRLVDMGVDPYLIAPTLILSMAQRLVKSLCGTPKKILVEGSIQKIIEKEFEDTPPEYRAKYFNPAEEHFIYEPQSSPESPSGLKGRTAVFEMFTIGKELERAILEDPTEQTLEVIARKQGMITMKEDAILKAMEGVIPFNEINTL
ncbi:MAG: type II/IV secretion system protein [Candidatus Pacebacteria bacterium]|nr:type II/IV secretion system protein [Candidatus Paceibacterota bacterium]